MKKTSPLMVLGITLMILSPVVLFLFWYFNKSLTEEFQNLKTRGLESTIALSEAQNALWQLRYGFPQFLALGAAEREKIVADEPKLYEIIKKNFTIHKRNLSDEKAKAVLVELEKYFQQYKEARPKWFQLISAGKNKEAAEWLAQTTSPFDAKTASILQNVINEEHTAAKEIGEKVVTISKTSMYVMFPLLTLSSLIGIAMVVFSRRVEKIKEDLGKKTNLLSFEMDKKENIFCDIKKASQNNMEISEKLHTSAGRLSDAAIKQASVAEETSASIEELASTFENVAKMVDVETESIQTIDSNIKHLNETFEQINISMKQLFSLANETASEAHEGEKGIQHTNESIEEISSSSKEITGIISLITDISDKTNLLSLNASIEAARAGEAGRGFAVVADEISKLANSTADSVRAIQLLIQRTDKAADAVIIHVGRIISAFKQISIRVGDINNKTNEVIDSLSTQTEKVKEIAERTNRLLHSTKEIENATREQKAATYDMTHTVQDQTVDVQDISDQTQVLVAMADELQNIVKVLDKTLA